jgi:hypothetical protein
MVLDGRRTPDNHWHTSARDTPKSSPIMRKEFPPARRERRYARNEAGDIVHPRYTVCIANHCGSEGGTELPVPQDVPQNSRFSPLVPASMFSGQSKSPLN